MEYILEDFRLRGLKCESILDVGANRAKWSRLAKYFFPEVNFYLIEAKVEMKDHLKAFKNEFSNSEYFIFGVAAKNE